MPTQREMVKRDSAREAEEQTEAMEAVRADLHIAENVDPLDAILAIDKSPEQVQDTYTVPLVDGNKVPWTIRALTGSEIDEANERCTQFVKRGRGERVKEVDQQRLERMLVFQATLNPDLSDPRLRSKFGAYDGEKLITRILLPGTYDMLAMKVLELSGFTDDLIETAGN